MNNLLFFLLIVNLTVSYGFKSEINLSHKNNRFQKYNHFDLFSGKVNFSLPLSFNQLNDAQKASEYPEESQRPNFVYEDKADKYKLAINYASSPAKDKDLPQITRFIEKVYKNVGVDFIESNFTNVNNKRFSILKFDYFDKSQNEKFHHYLFITTISGKLFMADYTAPSEQISKQEDKAKAILNSMFLSK